jgi:hypothetical protein
MEVGRCINNNGLDLFLGFISYILLSFGPRYTAICLLGRQITIPPLFFLLTIGLLQD